MSVQKCAHCTTNYWRYRGDHPPARYCSVTCRDEAKKSKKKEAPQTPETLVWLMRQHRLQVHETTSVLEWFDCEQCNDLEATYADSLDYWYARRTAEMVNGSHEKEA